MQESTPGRILTIPPERGRSPPAARRSVEVVWSIPEPFHQLCCCGPGRSAVRRWRSQDAPRRPSVEPQPEQAHDYGRQPIIPCSKWV